MLFSGFSSPLIVMCTVPNRLF